MSLASDLRILRHLITSPFRRAGDDHEDRLEAFYGGQAGDYDDFRERLLHGRGEMIRALPFAPGGTWIDLGGGTGANLEFLQPERLQALAQVWIVDLSDSLLDIARARIERNGWTNVTAVHGDALAFRPATPVDTVTFSYSLTMIPDWIGAIEHGLSLLGPDGHLGVVDFYVSRRWPEDTVRHGWWRRTFWPIWFGMDNVFLNGDLLPRLQRTTRRIEQHEGLGSVPYLPFRAPYFWYIGAPVSAAGAVATDTTTTTTTATETERSTNTS